MRFWIIWPKPLLWLQNNRLACVWFASGLRLASVPTRPGARSIGAGLALDHGRQPGAVVGKGQPHPEFGLDAVIPDAL